jgi:cytosolic iron-sulfur protein assembly protein CIAO1
MIDHIFVNSSGHSSTVWALSFNHKGDRMVSCRFVYPFLIKSFRISRAVTNVIQFLFSDDCTLKIWDTTADLSHPKTGDDQESW